MKKESVSAFFGLNKYRRAGAIASLLILAVLALAVAINSLTALLPTSIAKPNLTQKTTFEVSGESEEWLADNLDRDVKLYWLCKGGIASAESELYHYLCSFVDRSAHLSLEVVDPAQEGDAFVQKFGGTLPTDRSLIVESDLRYRIVDVSELYFYLYRDSSNSVSLSAAEYEAFLTSLMDPQSGYGEEAIEIFLSYVTPYFDGNARLINAINYVTIEHMPTLYTFTGSGASALEDYALSYLSRACIRIGGLTKTLVELPDDCDLLLINAPSSDLSTEDAAALSEFLVGGGKLILTTFYEKTDLPNLAAVLDDYGLGFEGQAGSFVLENDVNYTVADPQTGMAYPMLYAAHLNGTHRFSEGFGSDFVVLYPHAIKLTETDGVTLTSWLRTSLMGQQAHYDATAKKMVYDEIKTAHTVGAIAESGQTQILWIASPDALTVDVDSYSTSSANFSMLYTTLERMGGTETVSIKAVAMPLPSLTVPPQAFILWGVVLVLVIPVIPLAIGLIICLKRKNQ